MAFIGATENGVVSAAGYILAHNDEGIIRETHQIAQAGATDGGNGAKYVKMGTPYPSNDGNCIGLLYEDVDVSVGDMPGSVITGNAEVYLDRLPVTLVDAAKTALAAKGFTFIDAAPVVTRPY